MLSELQEILQLSDDQKMKIQESSKGLDREVEALEEVEEALDVEAKRLDLADGGALLESLRTRRLLETAELALKVRKAP